VPQCLYYARDAEPDKAGGLVRLSQRQGTSRQLSSAAQADDPIITGAAANTGWPAFRLRAPRFGGLKNPP
jgi:hypothetical protein